MKKKTLLLITSILLLFQAALDSWSTYVLVNVQRVAYEVNILMEWIVPCGALTMFLYKSVFIILTFVIAVKYSKEETALKIMLLVLLIHTFLTVYYIIEFFGGQVCVNPSSLTNIKNN